MTTAVLESDVNRLAACLGEYCNLLDELAAKLQLLGACQHGPVELVEAATSDLITMLQRVERVDRERRDSVRGLAEHLGMDPDRMRLEDVISAVVATQAMELTLHRNRLRSATERIEYESKALTLELGRTMADLEEVERIASGSPGTYDALGRASGGALRRVRGVG
jgi:hypothetical protein